MNNKELTKTRERETYQKLADRIVCTKISPDVNKALDEVYGQAVMAYELKAITWEDFLLLNKLIEASRKNTQKEGGKL